MREGDESGAVRSFSISSEKMKRFQLYWNVQATQGPSDDVVERGMVGREKSLFLVV